MSPRIQQTVIGRRRFIGEASCAAVSAVPVLNLLLNLKLANQAAAQAAPTDRKTLVCLFLQGGNDSYNMLVPRDAARHSIYSASRGNLALSLASLHALNQDAGGDGQLYGLHPSLAGLQELFNGLGGGFDQTSSGCRLQCGHADSTDEQGGVSRRQRSPASRLVFPQ